MTNEEYIKAQQSLAELKSSGEVIKDMQELAAKYMKRYFDYLIVAGFTADQALAIVISHGWMPKSPTHGGQNE